MAVNLTPVFCCASIALFTVGVVLVMSDGGVLPKNWAMFGDLAVKAAGLNYGLFTSLGGAVRSKPLWDALAEVLLKHSDLPKSAMRSDTRLLQRAAH